jgi:hypothetical protein
MPGEVNYAQLIAALKEWLDKHKWVDSRGYEVSDKPVAVQAGLLDYAFAFAADLLTGAALPGDTFGADGKLVRGALSQSIDSFTSSIKGFASGVFDVTIGKGIETVFVDLPAQFGNPMAEWVQVDGLWISTQDYVAQNGYTALVGNQLGINGAIGGAWDTVKGWGESFSGYTQQAADSVGITDAYKWTSNKATSLATEVFGVQGFTLDGFAGGITKTYLKDTAETKFNAFQDLVKVPGSDPVAVQAAADELQVAMVAWQEEVEANKLEGARAIVLDQITEKVSEVARYIKLMEEDKFAGLDLYKSLIAPELLDAAIKYNTVQDEYAKSSGSAPPEPIFASIQAPNKNQVVGDLPVSA